MTAEQNKRGNTSKKKEWKEGGLKLERGEEGLELPDRLNGHKSWGTATRNGLLSSHGMQNCPIQGQQQKGTQQMAKGFLLPPSPCKSHRRRKGSGLQLFTGLLGKKYKMDSFHY